MMTHQLNLLMQFLIDSTIALLGQFKGVRQIFHSRWLKCLREPISNVFVEDCKLLMVQLASRLSVSYHNYENL